MCEAEEAWVGNINGVMRKYLTTITPKVDRKSPAYARMIKAGFTIADFHEGATLPQGKCVVGHIKVRFTCICGRTETLQGNGVDSVNGIIDVAHILENHTGSVSAHHLRKDGFSIEQIKNIRRAYI